MPDITLTEDQQLAIVDWVTLHVGAPIGASVEACMTASDPVAWVRRATDFPYGAKIRAELAGDRADVSPRYYQQIVDPITPYVALPHQAVWMEERMANRERARRGEPPQELTSDMRELIERKLGDPDLPQT